MAKKKTASSAKQIPKELRGLLFLLWALFLVLSLVSFEQELPTKNWLGLLGYGLGWGLQYLFGLCSFLLPLFLSWWGLSLLVKKEVEEPILKTLYFSTALLSLCILLSALAHALPSLAANFHTWVYSEYYPQAATLDPSRLRHYLGGLPFYRITIDVSRFSLYHLLGSIGTFFISATLFLSSSFLLLSVPFAQVTKGVKEWLFPLLKRFFTLPRAKVEPVLALEPPPASEEIPTLRRKHPLKNDSPPPPLKEKEEEEKSPRVRKTTSSDYLLPPPSLLTFVKKSDASSLKNNLRRYAEILEETLLSFGIEAKVGEIYCGPTITCFEVLPAVGVKVQKIKALENDIALNMQAKSIRIIAPIPGKAAVGIEVPNPQPQEVSFRELQENYVGSSKKMAIPLLLGKMVNGEEVWADLTKMPHLIIAGATGSGKSVCVNTFVMSMLMNASPDEIKLLLVDPKKVELTTYSPLPHMLAPVITEAEEALGALKWLVKEMERRYEIFRHLGTRHIHNFNSRKIDPKVEGASEIEIPARLPYIVLIIDELADLMMVSTHDIETPIARIAQMARAVGIHMILATQRPSREVITGLIKANFPSRIAFKVASRVNSQIIIDDNGAESLLGNGDMLFLPPGSSHLIRAQGAFIRDEDINQVVDFILEQRATNYLLPSFKAFQKEAMGDEEEEMGSHDSLFEDAKSLVLDTGNASTTFLQRKLKIGYARAASLMDLLESKGIIGPADGAKPRKIFYPHNKNELPE